jgi:hypothetical protein
MHSPQKTTLSPRFLKEVIDSRKYHYRHHSSLLLKPGLMVVSHFLIFVYEKRLFHGAFFTLTPAQHTAHSSSYLLVLRSTLVPVEFYKEFCLCYQSAIAILALLSIIC